MNTPALPRFVLSLFGFSAAFALRAAEPPLADLIRDNFASASTQYTQMLAHVQGKPGFPRTVENGDVKLTKASEWTSGFFPGSLWFLLDETGDQKWLAPAKSYTAAMEGQKTNKGTHDLGFMMFCSFGNGLQATHDPHYRDVLLTAAESLSTRFNPKVGCIQSWGARNGWQFPVIIDNMMNLELLMWAAKESGHAKFRDIAITHADTTLKNHYRPDGSSFHVVDYNPATGAVNKKQTHQGAADSSAWARGQSWGLYGYTMMYRETQKPEYLAQAQKIAAFLMNHPRMPADKVPYWDYDAPGIPNVPRDSSAAAIMASALLELATFASPADAAKYRAFAVAQIRSLASPAYRAKVGENGNFLLMHATGHLPGKSEIDVPLVYGDYYFLEALRRAKALPKS